MGRFTISINDELHNDFSELSHRQGLSMNNLISRFILFYVCGHKGFNDVYNPDIFNKYISYFNFKTKDFSKEVKI